MINGSGSDPVSVWRSEMAELRKHSDLSVRALAVKTGYSSSYCGYAINGPTIPAWNVCEAVLDVLGAEPAEWIPRWQAARRAQGQPTDPGVSPVELIVASDGGRPRAESDVDEVTDSVVEVPAGAVIHNNNHVSVVVNPPIDDGFSPAHSTSASSGPRIRILGPTTTRWTVGTGAAVALVVAIVIGNSGSGQQAPAPAAASAPAVTPSSATGEPAATDPSTTAIPTPTDGPGTSSKAVEPVTVAAAASTGAPASSTTPAVATSAAGGAGTDPAVGVPGGHCKQVIGEDVRVFANPEDAQQTWASWKRGTLFWVIVGGGTSTRYATQLRNGQAAWVTKNTDYVAEASGCR